MAVSTRAIAFALFLAGVAVVGMTVSSEPVQGAADTWKSYESDDGGFSVEWPGTPKETETHQESFIGTITNHIVTVVNGKETYTVDYSDIPHMALHFAGADTIYSHAKGALLKKTFGKETSYTDIEQGKVKGKALTYDTPPVKDHPEMTGHAVMFLVDARLYVVDAVVPEAGAQATAKRFVASLKLEGADGS